MATSRVAPSSLLFNSMSGQQQQQQQQQQQEYNREEEYLQAQRSAIESVQVGRETLEQASRQGEQLEHAVDLADETQYTLDKAGRMLRGMTWSGWVANKFSRDIKPIPQGRSSTNSKNSPPDVYENVPDSCQLTAQAIQNYHANVKVLDTCETAEQKETLHLICDSMYDAAVAKLEELRANDAVQAYTIEFQSHLDILRERQYKGDPKRLYKEDDTTSPSNSSSKPGAQKSELMGSAAVAAAAAAPKASPTRPKDAVFQTQENHLEVMSEALGELGVIAKSLNKAVDHQNETIDTLDHRGDSIVEKSKMVTRRADRLIQKKSWTPVKPVFHSMVSIRHLETGSYLAVISGTPMLLPVLHKETAVFGLWKRQGTVFGLQNKGSRKWVGQNMFGSLACSAGSFGRREEWEAADDDTAAGWDRTRLLLTSAGWGAGGYILVRNGNLQIGGCGVEERQKADLWCIQEYNEENGGSSSNTNTVE